MQAGAAVPQEGFGHHQVTGLVLGHLPILMAG
jgi:hypothetical protein